MATGRPPYHSQALVPKDPSSLWSLSCWVFHLSQPCPALRRGRSIPHREIGWGLKGPRPERASGTGGPPQVGETRWLVGRHPPLSCRLGRSRRVLQVLLAHVPPQGCSQPQGPRQHHTHSPNPTHIWAGTLRGHTPPTGCLFWSGVTLMP